MKKVEKTESCSCECNWWGRILGVSLSAFGVIISIITFLVACGALICAQKSYEAAQASYDLNVLSAGWKENLQKMNELYASDAYVNYATERTEATISEFDQMYWNTNSIGDETIGTPDEVTDETTETIEAVESEDGTHWTLSADEIANLKVNWVIYGPENARITILEFADASCGYCKRQVGQDKTVDNVMAQYPNDVNVIFKNFPIFNETAAQAMACSEDYLTPENYHAYVVAVFQAEDATSVDALANLAANYGADATTIANCVNNGEKAEEVSATMSEGQAFGISGTPSSVVIDNESGKFTLIPGAYPVETFVEEIASFLN